MAKLRLWERRQTELAQIGSLELKTPSGAQKTLHKPRRAKKRFLTIWIVSEIL